MSLVKEILEVGSCSTLGDAQARRFIRSKGERKYLVIL